jgi:tRNA A-37 threonylcarbamoyl transferase component Bud32
MSSPTFVRSGKLQQHGTARNPWKVRRALPVYSGHVSSMDFNKVASAKRPPLGDMDAIATALRRVGVSVNPKDIAFTSKGKVKYVFAVVDGGENLRNLRKRLLGATKVDNLQSGGLYVLRLHYPMVQSKDEVTLELLRVMDEVNTYVHLRKALGDSVEPINFAGLSTDLGAFITASPYPEATKDVTKDDPRAISLVHRMIDAGVFPKSLNCIRKTEKNEYKVVEPVQLLEIPKGIHSAYLRLRKKMTPAEAWVASGGATWSTESESGYRHDEAGGFVHTRPVTVRQTMEEHLARVLQRPEHGKASLRPIDNHVLEKFVNLTQVGTLIGAGSYGKVFSLDLSKTRADLETVRASLTNTLYFSKLPRAGKVVLKIEKLDPEYLMTEKKVLRLAGESYIQQLVHENKGIQEKYRKGVPSVAPPVFFSGTIANAYHVICMAHVEGVSLWSLTKRGVVSNKVFNAMESAVKIMLRNGVVHSDLHNMNVMVEKGSGRVKILDFGFATIIPTLLKREVVAVLNRGGTVEQAFEETGLLNMINRVKMDFTYYHSNMKMIKNLRRRRNLTSHTQIPVHPVPPSPSLMNINSRGSAVTAATVSPNLSVRALRRRTRT